LAKGRLANFMAHKRPSQKACRFLLYQTQYEEDETGANHGI